MVIIQFILICVVIGLVVWLVNTYLPLPVQIKQLIVIAAVVLLVLVLLGAMGLFTYDIQIPRFGR